MTIYKQLLIEKFCQQNGHDLKQLRNSDEGVQLLLSGSTVQCYSTKVFLYNVFLVYLCFTSVKKFWLSVHSSKLILRLIFKWTRLAWYSVFKSSTAAFHKSPLGICKITRPDSSLQRAGKYGKNIGFPYWSQNRPDTEWMNEMWFI